MAFFRNTQRSKSSKNRRKQEKKKYSTREGGNFEDLGLIAALHEVISATYKSTGYSCGCISSTAILRFQP